MKGVDAMANWARGQVKIVGMKTNLRDFLLNIVDDQELNKAECSEDFIYLSMSPDMYRGGFHLPGTRCHYIDDIEINVKFSEETLIDAGRHMICLPFSGIDGIDVPEMLELAKHFNIDFEMDVIEPWGGYQQKAVIIGGELVSNQFFEYNLYEDDE